MRILSALILMLFLSISAQSQGIDFFKGSWEEALAESKRTGKLIFVDAYTTWCGPCKKMTRNIFPMKEVGDFYNANFINTKFDMEKGEGRKIRSKYKVNAFPTFLFVDGSGKLQYTSKGAKPAPVFIKVGKTALSKADFSVDYAEKYEEGDRDPILLYNYAMALKKSRKPSLKVANEYLRTQDNLNTEKNLLFIYELATESDSRIFKLLTENRAAIEKAQGKTAVNQRIEAACNATVEKAIEFSSPDLLSEAKANMSAHYPEKAEAFNYTSDMSYFKGTGDGASYLKVCDKYLKKTGKNNAALHNKIAGELLKDFGTDLKVMQKAEGYAKKAAQFGGLSDYHFTHAMILLKNGKKDQALIAAQKAKSLGDEEKSKNVNKISAFIKKLEAEL